MSITPITSLVICVLGSLMSIASLITKHWITGVIGLAISGLLWYNHYKSVMKL